jgi:hypothetical protein
MSNHTTAQTIHAEPRGPAATAGGRGDFTSIGGIQADRYMVLVDDAYADEARRTLATRQAETPPTAGSQAPTTPA